MFSRSQYDAIAKAIACARQVAKHVENVDPLDCVADTFAGLFDRNDTLGSYDDYMAKTRLTYLMEDCDETGAHS